ncbi:crotonobetainyl-CoA hydratase [Paraburkholderia sp. BL23I1N1]|uniref:enoyl-CoA hydratase-related protein n=1 Tax=Paraburkholderia sp. BL23I1N1 TaxID=1938802 RepID=UPI000E75B50D|nr:enoyl-CoA hydratase-related protein [Paraburkholderia sp. BL23I1N1]RKE26105.1 crotonobetainyl-CoA hydratase [Paraburkholderia sp. BL23I1N1]
MTPETYRHCRYEVDGPLLTLTIDRPEVLNAMHPDAHREFANAFDRYAADPSLRVAIVTGAGERAFCVGTDLKALDATGDHTKPSTGFAGITHRFDLWKPLIAAVNGLCLGGGMEILAACDLGIAADHAQFGLPEPRVGLAALGGGLLQRLPRQIGMKDAMALVLTGNRLSAHDAYRVGLLNEVVPAAELMGRARALAYNILACAPLAVQASKQVMLQSLAHANLATTMHENYPLAQRMLASHDAREGPKAFTQKRPPNWTGR